MSKFTIFALLALFCAFSAVDAVWLYTAESYNLNYNLYAIDTESYSVYTIGKVRDSEGDMYTPTSLHYDNATRLLYGIANSRGTTLSKHGGIMAINATTAQVVWFNNCTGAPATRFTAFAFDSTRRHYVFIGNGNFGAGGTYYLTEEEMRIGNCSAMKTRMSNMPVGSYGGAMYMPQYDAFYYGATADFNENVIVANLSVEIGGQYAALPANVASGWWFDAYMPGSYYLQSNGTVWAMGAEYGAGASLLYQMQFPATLDQLVAGERVNGSGMKAILPRSLRAVTEGPAVPAAARTKWRSGYAGAIASVTPDGDLFVINMDTPAIHNVTRLSQPVVALESFGGNWNQIVAVINGTSETTLARLNISNGELTTIATLPMLFTSLTMGANGKMLAMGRVNPTASSNITLAEISVDGTVTMVGTFPCPLCAKAWTDGNIIYTTENTMNWFRLARRNATNLDEILTSIGHLRDYDVDVPVGATYGGRGVFQSLTGEYISDMSYHPPSQSMIWSARVTSAITSVFRWNATSLGSFPIVDFHQLTLDMAFFQYDSAWCSNRGAWNGAQCVCNNAGIVGSRCETVLPAPVAPPVAPAPVAPAPVASAPVAASPVAPAPVAPAPVAAPVSSPVAGTVAPGTQQPRVPVSDAPISGVSFGTALLVVAVALFQLAL